MKALAPIAMLLAAAGQAQAPTAAPSHALILIRSDRVGHAVDLESLVHGYWVKWPPWWDATGLAPLLALLTGHDWQADAQATAFRIDPSGAFATPVAAANWERRGLAQAAVSVLGSRRVTLVKRPNGSVTREGMVAALDPEMRLRLAPFERAIPSGGLIVYDAASWDDAAEVGRRVNGRVLTVLYPSTRSERWSPFWLSGSGWPSGVPGRTGVPGLIASRDLGTLLLAPRRFKWTADESPSRGGPNRWLAFYDRVRAPCLVALGGIAGFAALWSAWLVHSERRGRLAGPLILAVLLSFPAAVAGGAVARAWGLHLWPQAMAISFMALALLATVWTFLCRRAKGTHPLLGTAVASASVLLFVDPVWSPLSAQFGRTTMLVSPEATGALAASIVAVLLFAQGRSTSVRVAGGVLVLIALGVGVLARSWWTEAPAASIVIALAALAGVGLVRLASLGALALAMFTIFDAGGRFAWAPLGQIARFEDAQAINLAEHAYFLASPALLIGGVVVAAGLILGGRFLLHQIKRLVQDDSRRLGLLRAGVLLLAIGVVQPLWLHASLVTLFAWIGVLLFDGVWSL